MDRHAPSFRPAAALLAACGLLTPVALAQPRDATWTGPALGGSYFTGGNWLDTLGGTGVPLNGGSVAIARILSGASVDCAGFSTTDPRVWLLQIGAGNTLSVNQPVNWTISDQYNSGSWGAAPSMSIGGSLVLSNGATLRLFTSGANATHANNGLIRITRASGAGGSLLDVTRDQRFSGSGRLEFDADTAIINWTGTGADRITNLPGHTIAGSVGWSSNAPLWNEGTIDADLPGRVLGVPLGRNLGAARASNGGTLSLYNPTATLPGIIDNSGGVIRAQNNSVVRLDNCDLRNGVLETSGTGVIRPGSGNPVVRDVAISPGSTVLIPEGSNLLLRDTNVNNGTIRLETAGPGSARLLIGPPLTLTGNGQLVLSGPNARVEWTGTGAEVLTNGPGHTVRGFGLIGNGAIGIINQGLYSADVSGQSLTVIANTYGFTNSGVMQGISGGTLNISGASQAVPATNTNTVVARTGSRVLLNGNLHLTGGTLASEGSGFVEVNGGSVLISNVSIPAGSLILTPDNNTVELRGGIVNDGVIRFDAPGPNTFASMSIRQPVTFSGSGQVFLNGAGARVVWTGSGTEQVTNSAGHTFRGAGTFGAGAIGLTNNGLFSADISGDTLTTVANTYGFTNNGVMQATGGGTFQITGATQGTPAVNNGLITARTGSRVLLSGNLHLTGGTLASEGSGSVDLVGGAVLLSNLTIPVGSQVAIGLGATSELRSTITNNGVIRLDAGAGNATMLVRQPLTLAGSGQFVLAGSNPVIGWAGAGTEQLTNGPSHIIRGGGLIGNGAINIINQGLIRADDPARDLTMIVSTFGFTNAGIYDAANGARLWLTGGATATNNGQIIARNGSVVFITGNTLLTGPGTLGTEGTGVIWTFNATFQNTAIAPDASVVVPSNNAINVRGTIVNDGRITLGNGQPGPSQLVLNGAMTLQGGGRVVMPNSEARFNWSGTGTEQLTNGAGHSFEGVGLILNMPAVNAGILRPGLDGPTPTFGTLYFDRTLSCTPSSVAVFTIGGTGPTEYDRIQAGQVISLNGEIRLELAPAYQPPPGAIFPLMSGSSRTGIFASRNLPQLASGRQWRIEYTPTGVRARVALCAADIATEGSSDLNSGPDGFVTGTDFDVFIQAFFTEARNTAGDYIADLTDNVGQGGPDGFLTGSDFDYYVQAFFSGC
ncbi:MAG: hypothetical protein KIT68_02990 [Phycisphaeraceae bacterium]|nr:hypothetical protein [Phycisphaeraceae bacterium]